MDIILNINGKPYSRDEILAKAERILKNEKAESWEKDFWAFANEWYSGKTQFELHTSGSTGKPKVISVSRSSMEESAKRTIKFFGLKTGNSILCALPIKYIAGKMVAVRAFVGNLDLILAKPVNDPIKNMKAEKVDFCSLVPYQVEHILENESDFNRIGIVLIGGAKLSNPARRKLRQYNSQFYESYGMTETVSHIALRQISPETEVEFECLPGITVESGKNDCLVIHGTDLPFTPVKTNDVCIVDSPQRFQLIGRVDTAINTGGAKVFPENIEAKLENYLIRNFIVTSQPDRKYGQKVILVVEGKSLTKNEISTLKKGISQLDPFEQPKSIYTTTQIERTVAGKVVRSGIHLEYFKEELIII